MVILPRCVLQFKGKKLAHLIAAAPVDVYAFMHGPLCQMRLLQENREEYYLLSLKKRYLQERSRKFVCEKLVRVEALASHSSRWLRLSMVLLNGRTQSICQSALSCLNEVRFRGGL
jgi:hypothetical protein